MFLFFSFTLESVGDIGENIGSYDVFLSGTKVYENKKNKTDQAEGTLFRKTRTMVYQIPELSHNDLWESISINFDGLIFTINSRDDLVLVGDTQNCNWGFVFHNPEVSMYNVGDAVLMINSEGTHTMSDWFELTLSEISIAPEEIQFIFLQRSALMTLYGSHFKVWKDGISKEAGGGSVSFDGDGEPEISPDSAFNLTNIFIYEVDNTSPELLSSPNIIVWAQHISFTLKYMDKNGNLQTWTEEFRPEDPSPKKIYQFW